jgi:hypothetical protein
MRKILIIFIALSLKSVYAQDILPLKERAEFLLVGSKQTGLEN